MSADVSRPKVLAPPALVDDLFSLTKAAATAATAAAAASAQTSGSPPSAPGPSLARPKGMPRRSSRAAPPPPIHVQTSSPPRSHTSSGPSTGVPSTANSLLMDTEAGEEADNLGELVMTPSRNKRFSVTLERPRTPTNSGANGDAGSPLASPSWKSMETTGSEYFTPYVPPTRAPGSRPPSWHRNSLEVPAFGLGLPSPATTPDNAGFEPTPYHGIHARNLSVYFPKPGNVAGAPTSPDSTEVPGDSTIPDADRKIYGGPQDWQFGGGEAPPGSAGANGMSLESSPVPRGKRRGHHHKHSLSHNFFSFLDPTQTNPQINTKVAHAAAAEAASPLESQATSVSTAPTSAVDDKPQPVPMNITEAATTLSPLRSTKHDPMAQLLISFAVIEAVLGAGIWVEGQISGWHCLAGVGYLIVFDAMGVGVNLIARSDNQGWRSLQRPFGSSRSTSLWCFTQSVFLMFAAVYIAKEALEQVVLGAGAHEHGVGTHSHGEVVPGEERPFPHLFLALASATTLFSGAVLANHTRLVDATGPIFLPWWWTSKAFVKANRFLANPYTVTVAGTCALLLVAGIIVPSSSLQRLDSAVSLILTLLTSALAWPPTAAFAQVLLQTAPPAASLQMKDLRRALRDVADDRRVLGLGTFRCWAVNAGKPAPESMHRAPSAPNSRRGSVSTTSPSITAFMHQQPAEKSTHSPGVSLGSLADLNNALGLSLQPRGALGLSGSVAATAQVPLVVTLVVHVHPESSDRDVNEVTRLTWSKLTHAVNGRAGTAGGEGEVSVEVRRGWEGAD